MTTRSSSHIRVYCAMCRVASEVEGAAIPRKCPSCDRRGFLTLARRSEYVPDRSAFPPTFWTIPLREWWGEWKRREREGLAQLDVKTDRQRALVEGREPEPIGPRDV